MNLDQVLRYRLGVGISSQRPAEGRKKVLLRLARVSHGDLGRQTRRKRVFRKKPLAGDDTRNC